MVRLAQVERLTSTHQDTRETTFEFPGNGAAGEDHDDDDGAGEVRTRLLRAALCAREEYPTHSTGAEERGCSSALVPTRSRRPRRCLMRQRRASSAVPSPR